MRAAKELFPESFGLLPEHEIDVRRPHEPEAARDLRRKLSRCPHDEPGVEAGSIGRLLDSLCHMRTMFPFSNS